MDMDKIVMFEYWYDYIKPNYSEKTKLCYTAMDSLWERFDTSDDETERALHMVKTRQP